MSRRGKPNYLIIWMLALFCIILSIAIIIKLGIGIWDRKNGAVDVIKSIDNNYSNKDIFKDKYNELGNFNVVAVNRKIYTSSQLNKLKPKKKNEKLVALTFDDGPYPKVDNMILKALKKYDGKATFFVVGNRVLKYKDDMKKIHKSGNEIGNHSYNHKNLSKLKKKDITWQIDKTNKAIKKAIGITPKIVRVPYGAFGGHVHQMVKYPMIQWNVDTMDWNNRNEKKTYNNIMNKVSDGSIVLMHDLYETSGRAAVKAIHALHKKGYRFVTVSELYELNHKKLEKGRVYFGGKN